MPGTFVFRPVEANLTHNTEWFGKMDPYCSFLVGDSRIDSAACKKGGKHPHWNDQLRIPIRNQNKVTVELIDKDAVTKDDQIGTFIVDLNEIEKQGNLSKWYPLYYKNQQAGEVLLQSTFEPDVTKKVPPPKVEEKAFVSTYHEPIEEKRTVFVEQRQTVEPHTFMKEVEVVDTRPVVKEVEVYEPHKVLKEVQYTEAVPVKKCVETIEPHVVVKDVEVIEPRIVTKQIQVIENVPVMKQVEIIESVPVIKEIETYEPQTFTKKVEVTEQVPVKKQITVTEPYTTKKPVEYIEPIITTKTITKEVLPAAIINEQVTQEVGPASVIGYSTASSRDQTQLYTSEVYTGERVTQTQKFETTNVGGKSQTISSSSTKKTTSLNPVV